MSSQSKKVDPKQSVPKRTGSNRIPHGYVDQHIDASIKLTTPLPEIVAEFDRRFIAPAYCKVCSDAEYGELINALLQRGAGAASVSFFLAEKFNYSISPTTLLRHRRLHLNV